MSNEKTHLWEYVHPYYCEMQNFRARVSEGCSTHYESWQDFLGAWGDTDLDYNLLFRWDWLAKRDDDGEPVAPLTGNGGEMRLCFMLQRKGDYRCATVTNMREEDEPSVVKFLTERAQHMRSLWAPLL